MLKRLFIFMLLLFSVSIGRAEGEVVVLGDTPIPEFTLPDGSTLKNAFVWRRSSEGLMIVHDDGQYFLNFKLLPEDWKAAYLGEPIAPSEEPEPKDAVFEVSDQYTLMPILETITELTPEGRNFVLREGADENSQQYALALGILQSLLTGRGDDAKRLILIVEESGIEIESVERDVLFTECGTCNGEGRIDKECSVCGGSGKCPKCNGTGKRDSGIGEGKAHCTTCRGTGECSACSGVGGSDSVCRACRGRGRLLQKQYCEIKRDLYVHTVNHSANPDLTASAVELDRDRIDKVLWTLPGLENGAAEFYGSKHYTGAMDTNILVACVVHSLLQRKLDDAERFHTTIQLHYDESDIIDIKKYIKPCETCDSTGQVERKCNSCGGSGDCKRCGGDGQRDTDFLDKTIPCTTCRGNGKCTSCKGAGELKVRCPACNGIGRTFEQERAEIKRQLMVDALNKYFIENRPF